MRYRIKSFLIATVVVLKIGLIFTVLQSELIEIDKSNNKVIALQELSSITEGIEMNLNLSLQYSEFFELIIRKDPNISENGLKEYAELVLQNNALIDSISIAPGGIVTNVYPTKGNEEALGYNLLENLESDSYIARAIESDVSVTEGPVIARQGGLMLFNRKAVFTGEGLEKKFWGLASIAVRFDKILDEYGLDAESDQYLLALRIVDGDNRGDFLWGNIDILDGDAVTREVYLPGEVWKFGIYPQNGWVSSGGTYKKIKALFIASELIIFILVYWYASHYQMIRREAKRDSLTGSLNKRSFEKYAKLRLKEKDKQHALILIDLNKFKEINDTLGHMIGDFVLKETSGRISHIMRKSDRSSRIGGDEFAVFIYDIESEQNIGEIAKRIDKAMREPISVGDKFLEVSGSIGIAISNRDGSSYEDLYRVADKNMYIDKSSRT